MSSFTCGLYLCVRGRKQVHFHQSSWLLWSATWGLGWQGICVCRWGRPVLLQLCHLCCHPAFPTPLGPAGHSYWMFMGWKKMHNSLQCSRLEGSSCETSSEDIKLCLLKQMRKKASSCVGGDGGQAGLSPALIPCPPLTLPSGATDTQLEIDCGLYCPLSRGGGWH